VAGHPSKLEQKYGLIVTVITIVICVHLYLRFFLLMAASAVAAEPGDHDLVEQPDGAYVEHPARGAQNDGGEIEVVTKDLAESRADLLDRIRITRVNRRLVQPVGVHEASHGRHLGQVIVCTEAGHMRAQHLGGLPRAVAVHAVDP
jgi:hypothetical protein